MKKVCVYTDLDLMSGGFLPFSNSINLVVKDLNKACLIYDEVYIFASFWQKNAQVIPILKMLKPWVDQGILKLLEGDKVLKLIKHGNKLILMPETVGMSLKKNDKEWLFSKYLFQPFSH